MKYMKYTETLRKLFEVMEGRPDIKEVKFNRDNDSFDVISDTGVHVCFGNEFRNSGEEFFVTDDETDTICPHCGAELWI